MMIFVTSTKVLLSWNKITQSVLGARNVNNNQQTKQAALGFSRLSADPRIHPTKSEIRNTNLKTRPANTVRSQSKKIRASSDNSVEKQHWDQFEVKKLFLPGIERSICPIYS